MNAHLIIDTVKKKTDINTELDPGHPYYHGSFTPKHRSDLLVTDVIKIHLPDNSPFFLSVLFHELAHATGTPARLNRPGIASGPLPIFSELYAVEELIAETTAIKLMRHFKQSNDAVENRSKEYLDHFKCSVVVVPDIDNQVETAFNFILDNWLKQFDSVRVENDLIDKIKEFMKFS